MIVAVLLFGLLLGCAENHSVAARIADRTVAIDQVERIWDKLPQEQKKSKQDVLETLINRELLFIEAKNRDLDESARVLSGLEHVRRQRAVERLIEREVKSHITVSEAEIRTYYENSDLRTKREVRGRHLMVKTAAEAQTLYQALLDGEDFAELARRFSLDQQTADKGGDLGYWDESLMVGPVSKVLFSMQPGELSEPFQGREGYFHIVRVEDERPLTYESLKKRIKDRLYADRLAVRTAEFRTNIRKQFNLQLVEETWLQLVKLGKTALARHPRVQRGRAVSKAANTLCRRTGRAWAVPAMARSNPIPTASRNRRYREHRSVRQTHGSRFRTVASSRSAGRASRRRRDEALSGKAPNSVNDRRAAPPRGRSADCQ